MVKTTLDSSTIVLGNIYLIMALQLGLNWEETNCNTNSYLFQLGFIILYILRLFFHEWYNNRIIGRTAWIVLIGITIVLLLALGGYQGYTVFNNPDDFYYNADTKEGNETCFQNRIIFVGEIVIIVLTLFKDIYFMCCVKEDNP